MSYDEGIRPSQQALAELFCHEVEQSYDMKLMDQLVPRLVGDYGETHMPCLPTRPAIIRCSASAISIS